MITDIMPLTPIRMDILEELYKKPLRLKDLAQRLDKKTTLVYNTLNFMKSVLVKDQGVYSLDRKFVDLFEKVIIRYVLEKRLGNMLDFLVLMNKRIEIKELIFFGSFYKGFNGENSDLDLYIISDIDDSVKKKLKSMFSSVFKRDLDLKVVSSSVHMTKEDSLSNLYKSISVDKENGLKIPLEILG